MFFYLTTVILNRLKFITVPLHFKVFFVQFRECAVNLIGLTPSGIFPRGVAPLAPFPGNHR